MKPGPELRQRVGVNRKPTLDRMRLTGQPEDMPVSASGQNPLEIGIPSYGDVIRRAG